MNNVEDDDARTIYCGNLSEEVTDAILFELFNQAGPVENVRRPKDQNGRPKSFGFILYKHDCSVPYALDLLKGTKLFNRNINLNSRSRLSHVPVLDTHITEFTERMPQVDNMSRSYREDDRRSFRDMERGHRRETDYRNYGKHGNKERQRSEGTSRQRHSNKEKDTQSPTSWAELNSLRGKGSFLNGHCRDDLQRMSHTKIDSNLNDGLPLMTDFNALLQMGQQISMFSQTMGEPTMMPHSPILVSSVDLGRFIGGNAIFPSMQGRMSGGERNSPNINMGRRDHHESRGNTRNHPYSDRQYDEHREEHRRHDRGYSSSRSSHDRERRDRRSR